MSFRETISFKNNKNECMYVEGRNTPYSHSWDKVIWSDDARVSPDFEKREEYHTKNKVFCVSDGLGIYVLSRVDASDICRL